jgi:hypothetical protein
MLTVVVCMRISVSNEQELDTVLDIFHTTMRLHEDLDRKINPGGGTQIAFLSLKIRARPSLKRG